MNTPAVVADGSDDTGSENEGLGALNDYEEDDSDEDVPFGNMKKDMPRAQDRGKDEDSDEDQPFGRMKKDVPLVFKANPRVFEKAAPALDSEEDEESDDEQPFRRRKKAAGLVRAMPRTKAVLSDCDMFGRNIDYESDAWSVNEFQSDEEDNHRNQWANVELDFLDDFEVEPVHIKVHIYNSRITHSIHIVHTCNSLYYVLSLIMFITVSTMYMNTYFVLTHIMFISISTMYTQFYCHRKN
jgi:hypothetical protein